MPTRVTSKGQVTIPKQIREGLGLKAGSKVEFVLGKGHAILQAVDGSPVEALYGCLNRYAGPLKGRSHKEVMEEVRREVANEAAREGLPARRKRSS